MIVTVFGATGVVGRALVPLLTDHEVTAVSRTAREDPGARYVVADVASGDGVAAALEGADVVYYLVHSLGARDFEEKFIWARHESMASKIEGYLNDSKDRHFIAVGSLHLAGPRGLIEMLRKRGYIVRQK